MKHWIPLIAALTLVVCPTAWARQAPGQGHDVADSLGAALSFHRFHTDFDIGNGTYGADVNELGVAFRQYFGRDFSLAMELGYANLSMDGNPVIQGLSPHGYYGRITARYQWWLTGHFGLDFIGTGGYQRVHDTRNGNEVALRWWSYSVRVGPRYRIGWFNVSTGVIYRHASGDEQNSSASSNPSLGFSRTTNPYLDFDFTVTPHGTFGLHFEGGARRSAAMVFGYRFVSP